MTSNCIVVLAFLGIVLLTQSCRVSGALPGNNKPKPATVFIPNEDSTFWANRIYFKVKPDFKTEITPRSVQQHEQLVSLKRIFTSFGVSSLNQPFKMLSGTSMVDVYEITFDSKIGGADQLIAQIGRLPYILYAEKIPIRKYFYQPNDQKFSQQYALSLIQAPDAWTLSHGDHNIRVAIVDNALLTDHEDMMPNLWINPGEISGNGFDDDSNGKIDDIHGWDAADGNGDVNLPLGWTDPIKSHGTHCAGIAGASTDNTFGIASIGFNNKLVFIKTTMDSGYPGAPTHGMQGVAEAIAYGVDVISISWGGTDKIQTEQDLFNLAYQQGIIVVAAAGNSNMELRHYPAAYDHVIAVASTDQNDVRSPLSNFGSWVDVSAPGTAILSTLATGVSDYGVQDGTSMACPLVAGLAGLMKAKNPALTPDQILYCLKNSADNIEALNPTYAGKLGAGRINAKNALECCLSGSVQASFSINNPLETNELLSAVNTSTNPSGTSYTWLLDGTVVSAPPVSFAQTGIYTLELQANYGNCTFGQEQVIHVMGNNDISFAKKSDEYICDVLPSRSGGYLVGSVAGNPAQKTIQKLDHEGNPEWIWSTPPVPLPPYFTGYGGEIFNYFERGYFATAEDDDGTVVIAIPSYESSTSTHYITAFKLDGTTGQFIWQREFRVSTGYQFAFPFFLQKDKSGGFILVGSALPYSRMFMMKIDGAGNLLWNRFYNSTEHTQIKGFIQTADGGYLVYGNCKNPVCTNPFFTPYSAKLDQNGNVSWSSTFCPFGALHNDEITGIYDAVELAGCSYWLMGRLDKTAVTYLINIDYEGNLKTVRSIDNQTGIGMTSSSYGKIDVLTALNGIGSFSMIDLDVNGSLQHMGTLEIPLSYYVYSKNQNIYEGEKIIPTHDNGIIFSSNSSITLSDAGYVLAKATSDNLTTCSVFPLLYTPAIPPLLKGDLLFSLDNSPPAILPVTPAYASPVNRLPTLHDECSFSSDCPVKAQFYLGSLLFYQNEPLDIEYVPTGATSIQWQVDADPPQTIMPVSFPTFGPHDIKLTVSNGTCYNELTRRVFAMPQPDATFSMTTISPGVIRFDAALNSGLLHYTWDFGDGITGTGASVVHSFASEGVYNVCLTVGICERSDQQCQSVVYQCPVNQPAVMDISICPGHQGTFMVQNPGTNTINWFNELADVTAVGVGASFTTPVLSATEDYYVEFTQPATVYTAGMTGPPLSYTYRITNHTNGLHITAGSSFFLRSFQMEICQGGSLIVEIKKIVGGAATTVFNYSGTVGSNQTMTIPVPSGANFFTAGEYMVAMYGNATVCLYEANTIQYPFEIAGLPGIFVIDGYMYSVCCLPWVSDHRYPMFFNFEINLQEDCVSPREEVIITVVSTPDTDGDGVPDACDPCPLNNPDDTDSDGICDANDQCPGLDDALIGAACNDGDPCTVNDTYSSSCNCVGTFQDSDGDGTCDASDLCPTDPNKILPGVCGCGFPDTDTDGDGTPDCNDPCATDPNKILPGICGCQNPEPGTPCNDGDPCTINDVINSSCLCAGTFQDTDADGICDAMDQCPGEDDNTALQQIFFAYLGSIGVQEAGTAITRSLNEDLLITGFERPSGSSVRTGFLTRLDRNGGLLWKKVFPLSIFGTPSDIVETNDGGIVILGSAGISNSDFFVLKTDNMGNYQWSSSYGNMANTPLIFAKKIRQTSDDGYIITGSVDIDGNTGYQMFLAKLTETGQFSGAFHYGAFGGADDYATGVVELPNGDFLVTGSSAVSSSLVLMRTNPAGLVTWTKGYTINNVNTAITGLSLAVNNNEVFISGHFSDDVFLSKFQEDGTALWFKSYQIPGIQDDCSMAVTNDGGLVAAGQTQGGLFMLKTGGDGSFQWFNRYFGSNLSIFPTDDRGHGSVHPFQAYHDGFVMLGSAMPSGTVLNDMCLIRTDEQGEVPCNSDSQPVTVSDKILETDPLWNTQGILNLLPNAFLPVMNTGALNISVQCTQTICVH